MDDELFILRVLERLDNIDKAIQKLCDRLTALETIHEVSKSKFNQLMAVIAVGGVILGIVITFLK